MKAKTLSQIFKAAHKQARIAAAEGYSYSASFQQALADEYAHRRTTYRSFVNSTITVNRPDGTAEVVTHTQEFNDKLFARAAEATKKAGRGNLISYKNNYRTATYYKCDVDLVDDSYEAIQRAMTLNGKSF